MMTKLLSSLALFFFFSSSLLAQCPTCNDYGNLSISATTVSGEGEDCKVILKLEGLGAFLNDCFEDNPVKIVPTGNSSNTINGQLNPDNPLEWIYYPNHSTNEPITYEFTAILNTPGCPLPAQFVTQNVDIQCCQYNETTGLSVFLASAECERIVKDVINADGDTIETIFEKCIFEFATEAFTITPDPSTFEWNIGNSCQQFGAGGNFNDRSTWTVVLQKCPEDFELTVTVDDEFGCPYSATLLVNCTADCGDPDDPCAGLTTPFIEVNPTQTSCIEIPSIDVSICTYELTVTNPQPNQNYVWQSSQGVFNPDNGTTANVIVTSTGTGITSTTLYIYDTPTGCPIDSQQYELVCPLVDGDCTEVECENPQPVDDFVFEVADITTTCTCDYLNDEFFIGAQSECEFLLNINIPDNMIGIVTIFENSGASTNSTLFGENELTITKTCGTGSLASLDCLGSICIQLLDFDGCLVAGDCIPLNCDFNPCLAECLAGPLANNGGDGGGSSVTTSIYPNPLSLSQSSTLKLGQLSDLDLSTSPVVEVFSITGQQMKTVAITDEWNQEINVQDFAPGIYLLKISSGGALWKTGKVVILE